MLVEITPEECGVELDIVYASERNFTGKKIYSKGLCFLHCDAKEKFNKAKKIANDLGYKIKIFDAFRPLEAQWLLWEEDPNPEFLTDPRSGSPHSRGVAIDLTLIGKDGKDIDMGTDFDSFTNKSHHGNYEISKRAQQNRLLLLGIMTLAGWDFYKNEWWHYQLFNARNTYDLLSNEDLKKSMMLEKDILYAEKLKENYSSSDLR